MVRASVTYNSSSKSYEWKILQKDDPYVFEIVTPRHNMCIIRNYPLAFDTKNRMSNVQTLQEIAGKAPSGTRRFIARAHPLPQIQPVPSFVQTINNLVFPSDVPDVPEDDEKQSENTSEVPSLIKIFQKFPLSPYFYVCGADQAASSFSGGFSRGYSLMNNPVKSPCMANPDDMYEKYSYNVIASIHVDILLHVLEFDKQCLRDQMMEHSAIGRPTFAAEMEAIVNQASGQTNVPIESLG